MNVNVDTKRFCKKYALHYLHRCCESYPYSLQQVFDLHKPPRAACCQQQVTNMQLLIQEEIVNFMAAVAKKMTRAHYIMSAPLITYHICGMSAVG